MWSVSAVNLFASVFVAMAADTSWTIHSSMSPQMLHVLAHAKNLPGITWFLRQRRSHTPVSGLPMPFAFVKSKCYNDDGEHTCKKESHSCCRRVLDTSAIPFASAWKVMGRDVRAVLQALEGHELFD